MEAVGEGGVAATMCSRRPPRRVRGHIVHRNSGLEETAGVADPAESDRRERALVEVLAAEPQTLPQPPTLNPAGLPFGELAPPMFERLVAEVVLYVDGLGQVRVYGRSGQAQDGLDIVGGPAHDRSVYQVRRIERLTPPALRKAVLDYAGPPGTPASQRRFAARRFVLAAACT